MNYRYMPLYMQGNEIRGIYYSNMTVDDDRDIDYVKEMYPLTFSRIQELVEKECDMQEFIGSMMFDEYPDKLSVMQIVNRIFDTVKKEENECAEKESCTKYPSDQWLKDIIMVLLLNEMYRRRRKNRTKFY
jgi:hypothetical protein